MKRIGKGDEANHVLNITIVDDFLNKKEIRDQPPSRYMAKFRRENPSLAEAMKSHLILDLDDFGVWGDDYDTFWDKRAEAVSDELKKRIIAQDIDKRGQAELADDYDGESPELIEMGK